MTQRQKEKMIAIIAYAPFVGFVIAYFMNREISEPFVTWHIKNMFGLFLLFIVALIVQAQINLQAGDIIWFLVLLLWIYSIVMALMQKKKGVPFFDNKFQHWFTFLD